MTEGRVRAVAAGMRTGLRPKLTPTQRVHVVEMRGAGKSLQEIGDMLGVSHMTIWRHTDRVPPKRPRGGGPHDDGNLAG